MISSALIQKLWNSCNILRDDGLSYGDYASMRLSTGSEQLTFLLFLKMADEQSRPLFIKPSPIPKSVDWQSLMRLDCNELETHYRPCSRIAGQTEEHARHRLPEGAEHDLGPGEAPAVDN